MEEHQDHHHQPGCCCNHHGMGRRAFMATVGGGAVVGAALAGMAGAAAAAVKNYASTSLNLEKKELTVQPALVYQLFQRAEATSWRSWGGLMNQADVDAEVKRIEGELADLAKKAEFKVKFLPVAKVSSMGEAETVSQTPADVMLMYGAAGDGTLLEKLTQASRYNLLFLRHRSGPVYLWYEIASPRFLRKTVDELGQPGITPEDVVVDAPEDLLWRLRSMYALKNTLGSKMIVIGGPSGWGQGGQKAPEIAANIWKMQFIDVPYADLGSRITSAKADASRVAKAEKEAADYLKLPGIRNEVDEGPVKRAFLLKAVFEDLMGENGAQAMTVNNCMSTIMPMSETTACLPLSVLNDSGALAFCESDFVVIPSGVLLHNICQTPVFLNDPTYPHHGMITVAHCTAPSRMDGKKQEKTRILTHFESDYGAAPKVDMKIGQTITMIDPDFNAKKWIGFRGKILANPFMPICRSQVDVSIEGDCDRLARDMVGFHWMMSYGDHLKEVGYALSKVGIEWDNLSDAGPEKAV